MLSKTAVTFEIDDLDIAADELYSSIFDGFAIKRNSVGILYCYSDMEIGELVTILKAKFPFEIIGCSTIASMDQREGFHEMAVTLLVLTADDCEFATSVSGQITTGNTTKQITAAYNDITSSLSSKPELIFAFPPYMLEIMLDEYTNLFNDIAAGVPVLGGLPSYNGTGDTNCTIYDGNIYPDRMVMLAVSGNIKPVSTVQTLAGIPVERKRKVTKSKDNVIYRVGDQTFVEYLESIGLPVNSLAEGNNTVSFVANPILVEYSENGDSYRFLRTLHDINLSDGSGTAIGQIPENSTISICPLTRSDIAIAAERGISELDDKMKANRGYKYNTVIGISCIGRHVLMAPESSTETEHVLKGLPQGLNLAGFYSYGEIGPYPSKNGAITFAHNESMVLCAF